MQRRVSIEKRVNTKSERLVSQIDAPSVLILIVTTTKSSVFETQSQSLEDDIEYFCFTRYVLFQCIKLTN